MPRKALWFVFLISAALLAAQSAVQFAPRSFPGEFLAQVEGTVGLAVGVAPNSYNTLDQQLQTKQAYINGEEAALQSSTAATAPAGMAGEPLFVSLVVVAGVLFILVVLNFYFDWRLLRAERQAEAAKVPSDPQSPTGEQN